ncbi:MAG: hypothetical protein RLZZ540_339 [Bacteroidota bacterium]|jgi:glycosyltransferase involved in cell wall biosynthesis
MKKVLLDALYINMGGGKVLLNYLIEKLEDSSLNVHFLLDERIKGSHSEIQKNKVTYLKTNVLNRYKFYESNRDEFNKIFCFASLPPLIRVKAEVYTYFHQSLYLKVPDKSGFKLTVLSKIKSIFSRVLKQNTDFWIVQSSNVKNQLEVKYNLREDQVKVIPFYPHFDSIVNVERNRYRYTYVSLPANYKNHERLIKAFVLFYEKTGYGELHLTITKDFPNLLNEVERLQLLGIPIVNHGFLNKMELITLYKSSEYVVFPSLVESFGLGIVEALENGCKIIGADLPYMRAVCEPSISFNPELVSDILLAFEKSINSNVKLSRQLLFDEIEELIELLG